MLTGDTLMIGGSGRTDFPGADAGKQYDAVVRRPFSLPDDTVVWPAHDYRNKTATTIGEEQVRKESAGPGEIVARPLDATGAVAMDRLIAEADPRAKK